MPVEGQARKQNAYILVCDCQCSINKKQLDIRRNWFKLFRTKKKSITTATIPNKRK